MKAHWYGSGPFENKYYVCYQRKVHLVLVRCGNGQLDIDHDPMSQPIFSKCDGSCCEREIYLPDDVMRLIGVLLEQWEHGV